LSFLNKFGEAGLVHLLEEGFDVGIHIGELP
jgi:hypothetical protein